MNKFIKTFSAGIVATGLVASLTPVSSAFASSASHDDVQRPSVQGHGAQRGMHRENEDEGRVHRPGIRGSVVSMNINSDGSGTLNINVVKPNTNGERGEAAQNGETLTVTFTSETSFGVRNMGRTNTNAILVGDVVVVRGDMQENGTYKASDVRNMSAFATGKNEATVQSIDTTNNTMVISVVDKDGNTRTVTVNYNDSTKIKQRNMNKTETDIHAGSVVKVKGIGRKDASGNPIIGDVFEINIK